MITPTLDCCPRQDCGGFVVQETLYDGAGRSNFNVVVYKCLLCARIFEGEKQYGVEVGRLADGKCYRARPTAGQGAVDCEVE